MNWEAIGAIGEILGALAVLITLAYLAIQVKQTQKTLRAQAAQARTEVQLMLMKDRAELSRNYPDDDDLTQEGREAWTNFHLRIMINSQNTYYQHKLKLLDEMFSGPVSEEGFGYLKNSKLAREVWDNNTSQMFGDEFVNYVNGILQRHDKPDA